MGETRKYFGTDGIRGAYGTPNLCDDFARTVGSGLAKYIVRNELPKPHRVLIGRDTRASGMVLVNALAQGLASEGVKAIDAGVSPTPAIALSILSAKTTMGIAVTASHNPATDNGIKIFSGQALKLPDSTELEIERLIDETLKKPSRYRFSHMTSFDSAALYREKMAEILPKDAIKDWTIATDTAHGAATFTTPVVLAGYGANVQSVGNAPDGANINENVGSEHPESIRKLVRATGARIGIAHDGDADRVVLCDERGELLDGDEVLALIGLNLLSKGLLAKNTLVATVMSNLALDEAVENMGGKVARVDVGDRYILESMLANGYNFGGEPSGHIIFKDVSTTGDGFLAALRVIAIMFETGKPLSQLRKTLNLWPQIKKNIKVKTKIPFNEIEGWHEKVAAVEKSLVHGRVLCRYSGTEPKIRLLVEARDKAKAERAMKQIEKLVYRNLEKA